MPHVAADGNVAYCCIATVKKTSTVISFPTPRKIIVAVLGSTILALGIALIVLPGPAVVVIPLGLTILATEFLWARRLLRRVKHDTNGLLGEKKR
jgi:Putative transmembrane protein (PGPGW)